MKSIKLNKKIINEQYGVKLGGDYTSFKVWSPSSKNIKLCLYDNHNDIRRKTKNMVKNNDCIWTYEVSENLEGKYYTYLIDDMYEVVDPYVHSTNANSTKGMIIDATKVNPDEFLEHVIPESLKPTESIIYELHVKDFSMDHDAYFKYHGKYLSFTEKGLVNEGQKIGIDHLIELGVTHVHLLPVFDFISVNDYDKDDYNWGYDPYLFNSLEGSYATNPDDGSVRIIEFKQMIMALHEANIRVILDVVYNHTYFAATSNFHRLMPYVFHRFDENMNFTNGSGCGCELDTENEFVQNFIVTSLKFWLNTYKVDGFRFDLMALYDCDTMRLIEKELTNIKPDILIYGEPWVGGSTSLPFDRQFNKSNQKGSNISLFNDDFRNAIKGSNDGSETGFIGGGGFKKNDIFAGCVGSIEFSNSIIGFASKASKSVNYVSSHDNLILMDKFNRSFHFANFEEKQNMNALSLSIILLSFGVPFIQAGTEFLRSKYGHHNTYNSGNYVNRIDWSYKKNHRHVFDYVKLLIDFRKSQKVFSLTEPNDIKKVVQIKRSVENVVMYEIKSTFEKDFKNILIVYNGGFNAEVVDLDSSLYTIYIDGALYHDAEVKIEDKVLNIPKLSTAVCVIK